MIIMVITYLNESTEVQTLGAIRIQLYHQCSEQVWQHNFTSVFEGRHNAIDLRWSAHRSSIFESRHIDLRRLTHRYSKIEGRNIAPTTQHRADIPTIRHGILSTTALHNCERSEPVTRVGWRISLVYNYNINNYILYIMIFVSMGSPCGRISEPNAVAFTSYYTQDSARYIHTVYITLDEGTHAHTSGICGNGLTRH